MAVTYNLHLHIVQDSYANSFLRQNGVNQGKYQVQYDWAAEAGS
jgi:hypothetical protein